MVRMRMTVKLTPDDKGISFDQSVKSHTPVIQRSRWDMANDINVLIIFLRLS